MQAGIHENTGRVQNKTPEAAQIKVKERESKASNKDGEQIEKEKKEQEREKSNQIEKEKEKEVHVRKRGRPTISELRLRDRSNSVGLGGFLRSCEERKESKKREREERRSSEEDQPNKKSNNLKSPESQEKMEKKELMGALEAIRKDIREGRENTSKEIKQLSNHIENIEKGWKEREEAMMKRLEEIESRLTKVEEGKNEEEKKCSEQRGREGESAAWEELRRLKKIMEDQEKRSKRNNLIMIGLETEGKGVKETAIRFLEERFKIGKKVKSVWKTGPREREIAVVEMENWDDKQYIFKNKNQLKGTNTFIEHDLTKEEREV